MAVELTAAAVAVWDAAPLAEAAAVTVAAVVLVLVLCNALSALPLAALDATILDHAVARGGGCAEVAAAATAAAVAADFCCASSANCTWAPLPLTGAGRTIVGSSGAEWHSAGHECVHPGSVRAHVRVHGGHSPKWHA